MHCWIVRCEEEKLLSPEPNLAPAKPLLRLLLSPQEKRQRQRPTIDGEVERPPPVNL